MGTLQQAPYADLRISPEGPEAQEGNRPAEARAWKHVAARQLLEMGEA
jgi:hypothetical protein